MQGIVTSIPFAAAANGTIRGTVSTMRRHDMTSFIMYLTGDGFPYGIVTVTISGTINIFSSFLIGLIVPLYGFVLFTRRTASCMSHCRLSERFFA